ncbi:hypothetical protein, partial [Mesorhizobium sp. M2D.F.Ca.ET.232.01.1.1]|uniref:hypothetical protein n=1 Tax=Mesorhizobium sp. M2D.F.Ca.ET.232.01.1.1 TaxID=2496670 RepID=UPI001AEE39C1
SGCCLHGDPRLGNGIAPPFDAECQSLHEAMKGIRLAAFGRPKDDAMRASDQSAFPIGWRRIRQEDVAGE